MMIHINTDRYDIALNLPSIRGWSIYKGSGCVWLKWDTKEEPEKLGYSGSLLDYLPEIATLARALGIKALLIDDENAEGLLKSLRCQYGKQLTKHLENLNINS